MIYWDTSAIVSLCAPRQTSVAPTEILERDSEVATWWASSIECASALNRLQRERSIGMRELVDALADLDAAARNWSLIPPGDFVKGAAMRILRFHPMRAADALQLAAALVAAENDPGSLEFVCMDRRLSQAAQLEGFQVVVIE